MNQFLKSLNANKNLNENDLLSLINNINLNELQTVNYSPTSDNFRYLIEYKHAKTHDNVLIYAARFKNLGLIKFLFDSKKFDFGFTNKDGKNSLHEACQANDLECVRYLVEVGRINVNSLRKGDWTPLMLACTRDNLEVIKFLVNNGADFHIRNKDGWNAFHVAVREGHVEIVKYFLDLDLSLVKVKSNNLRTVLHTAALHGHYEITKLLAGLSDVDLKDSCGITPLMDSIAANHVNIATLLVESYHANFNEVDMIGNSCVHIAAQAGALDSLNYLINSLNVNFSLNNYKMTPIHSACKNNHCEVVEFLVDNTEIDINQKDMNGRSALDICANGKYQKCIDLLISKEKIKQFSFIRTELEPSDL